VLPRIFVCLVRIRSSFGSSPDAFAIPGSMFLPKRRRAWASSYPFLRHWRLLRLPPGGVGSNLLCGGKECSLTWGYLVRNSYRGTEHSAAVERCDCLLYKRISSHTSGRFCTDNPRHTEHEFRQTWEEENFRGRTRLTTPLATFLACLGCAIRSEAHQTNDPVDILVCPSIRVGVLSFPLVGDYGWDRMGWLVRLLRFTHSRGVRYRPLTKERSHRRRAF
jgi:hypothetical protein